ncbi:MAG: glycerate dehydrogenase [Candidatus Delongbacteria bacterium]|nr:glycerate dehydrogenase [Candidatus Delongbacteria bacterium]
MAGIKISIVHKVRWTPQEHARLEAIGEARFCPDYPSGEEDLLERMRDAHIVISATNVAFPAGIIESCSTLRMISLWSTGYNNVDREAAKRCGVTVTNVPGYAAYSVSEHAWAMVLHLAKRLGPADAHVRKHGFDWASFEGLEIHGLTVGIIGTGQIGARSAAIANGFGCRVLAFTRRPSPERARALGVQFVDLPELLAQSDIIMIHAALEVETRGLLDQAAFAAMARRPILVNTARGAIIEMDALLDALESGQIRGAGLDVFWDEPPHWDTPGMQRLLAADKVVLSPHSSMYTDAAFRTLTRICIDNIEAFLNSQPANVVS